MTQGKSIQLFLAVSLTAAVGTQVLAAVADETNEIARRSTTVTAHVVAEGGEGGEGGAVSENPDVNYMTALGLMKGHLIVAQELMEAGKSEEAVPHIEHPVEELYSEIETELPARNVEDFRPTLNELTDLAKTVPDSPEVKTLFTESLASIDEAIAAVPEAQRQSPDVVMEVIVQMLQTAAAEYEAAIANNQFVEIVEYQDSRGFVIYGEELYQNVADTMSQERPEDHQVIVDSFAELKTAWPSIDPPSAPIKSPAEINSLVSQIAAID